MASLDKDFDGLGSWSEDGVLVAALFFTDGETGYFEGEVGAYAEASVVPLPSALFLFGSGLLGVACWRRKREIT
ncbi:PEP-CTERM sorting domain-containing protein [Thermosulfurimonas marina]|uniref:PEP-CTERM sorting domain-containing protein n=1 Tax=Thermosulfurimonas marina TaxID=2047767 RepID=A0A6H1WQW4_9BACT|nr:PEP-CTERM sorting domain-containing protein [Thermosulfurimonas marina]QJA05581.1 PEP-CTERM sorting domain-containing protein [Thermosulfurimonas marina]